MHLVTVLTVMQDCYRFSAIACRILLGQTALQRLILQSGLRCTFPLSLPFGQRVDRPCQGRSQHDAENLLKTITPAGPTVRAASCIDTDGLL